MEKVTIGIDLGGTLIKLGLMSQQHLLQTKKIEAVAEGKMADRLPIIKDAIDALLREQNLSKEHLQGIGIAFPSVIDPHAKKILSRYVKFTDADEIDLEGWTQEHWDTSLALENDARAALVGEWQYGAGRGIRNIVMITLGTGVGSGVLIDGRLLRGAHHLGGNLGGHTIINLHGDQCNCGSFGCVETEASGWAVHQKYQSDPIYAASALAAAGEINYKDVFMLADHGDGLALKIRDHSLKTWAAHTLNFVHHFDPEAIILGGGIMKSGDLVVPYIQKFIDQYSWLPPGATRVVAATQSDYAGVLGMGYLANQQAKKLKQ